MSDPDIGTVHLAAMRKQYSQMRLRRDDLCSNPIKQFQHWLADVTHARLTKPDAMSLATVGADGRSLVRTVCSKGSIPEASFLTKLDNSKVRQIADTCR